MKEEAAPKTHAYKRNTEAAAKKAKKAADEEADVKKAAELNSVMTRHNRF